MNDALGNEIIIDKYYGYSQSSNGVITIVMAKVDAINEATKKVTLSNIHERSGVYGNISRDFVKQDRRRSVYGCSLFPILTLAEYRNQQIDEILKD